MRKLMLVEEFGNRRSIRPVAEHADLDRRNADVRGERIQLRAQLGSVRDVRAQHSLRGLHRQRGNGRDAVAIVRGESFQIGGGAGAARRIKSGNGQQNGRGCVYVVGHLLPSVVPGGAPPPLSRSAHFARREEQSPATIGEPREPALRNVRAVFLSRKRKFAAGISGMSVSRFLGPEEKLSPRRSTKKTEVLRQQSPHPRRFANSSHVA